MKLPVPPLAPNVIDPPELWQGILEYDLMVPVTAGGLAKVIDVVLVHPLASITCIVYVPEVKLMNVPDVKKSTPSIYIFTLQHEKE